jgi:DNA-binding NarL/FixJ family response regulator
MHIAELHLSPNALVCLRAADITDVDQLVTLSADGLIERGIGAAELYEVVCQLNKQGTSLPSSCHGNVYMPNDRNRDIFRLRIVEGLTLKEVGERFGINAERVRQILARHFGLRGSPPTVKAKKWATTERRRAASRAPSTTRRKVA